MAKTKPLLDDVLSRARVSKPGTKTWFDRLPAETQAELDAVKQAFNPVVHQKRSYAKAIMEAAAERGWEVAGIQGVIAWLNKR